MSDTGLPQHRQRALGEVAAELSVDRRDDQPAVALRDYGPGCVCLGVAGPVDRATAERLQSLLRELRVRGRRDLVITLAGLGAWHPQLARVLAHARIKHLVNGGYVEFHDLPDPLAAALGSVRPTTYLVLDTADTTPRDPPGDHRPTTPPSPRPTGTPTTSTHPHPKTGTGHDAA